MTKEEAIAYYGTATKLADALGISPAAVTQWGDEIPMLRQYQLKHITRGRLKVDKPKDSVA